jgi:capsular polysaccharide biosynthesis protein
VYAATATVLASAQDPNQRDFGVTLVTAPALDIATYQAAIRSRQVLADALLGLTGSVPSRAEVDALGGSLTLRAEEARTSSILRVTVRDVDPTQASERANAVAAAAVRWDERRATRSLETIVASLQAQIASIDAELAAASADVPVEG